MMRGTLAAIAVLVMPLSAPAEDLKRDVVAAWDFSEGEGTVLHDKSGHGHHGQIHGATWVSGSWGRGLRFDRSRNQFVLVADSPRLRLQPPFTIGVWFRTTSSRNNAVYLVKSGGTFTGCGIYYYGDSRAMYVDAKGVDDKLYHKGGSSSRFPSGTWHHAVYTLGGGKQRLYVDGRVFVEREVPTDLKLTHAGTQGVHLGRWAGNGHFDGVMGKAYLLAAALAPNEVQRLYARERETFNDAVSVKPAVAAPLVDGVLDDSCWQAPATWDSLTRLDYDATQPRYPTRGHVTFDSRFLYLSAHCTQPGVEARPVARRPRDDRRILEDDRVEWFLETRQGIYRRIVLSSSNSLFDEECRYEVGRDGFAPGGLVEFSARRAWDAPGIRTAVYRTTGAWTAEVAIPLSSLGVARDGTTWRFNVARVMVGREGETSSLSPVFERLEQADRWSTLRFQKREAVLNRAARKPVSIDLTPLASTNRAADATAEPQVFSRHYLERGSYTSVPPTRESTDVVDLSATLGEYEPATVSVRANDRPLKQVRLEWLGDLKSGSGAVIPVDEHAEIRVVELWRRQMDSRRHMYMERFLERVRPLDIPRATTRRFWITLHVPETAEGGVYRGRIRIAAGEESLRELTVRLRVLPFRLQPARGMGYFMYLPTWGIPPKLRTASYLKRIFEDMRRHGMTTATLYPYGVPFGDVMDVLRDSRLMQSDVPAIWLGADAVGPERWKEVLDRARDNRWPELALYLQDEPGNAERIQNAKRLFKRLDQFRKTYPEHRKVRSTTAIGTTGIKALGDQYDIWIAGAGFDESLVQQSHRMKKLLWSYDCNLAPVDAESNRFYFGQWCWKTGIKGSAIWAYADPGATTPGAWDNVLKDLHNTELHYCFVRPTPGDLVPTIGWEAIREGIDDHNYLSTVAQLAKVAAGRGLKRESERAEKTLHEITSAISSDGHRARTSRGEAGGLRMGNHYDRSPGDIQKTIAGYRQFRKRLAQEILRLRESLEQ